MNRLINQLVAEYRNEQLTWHEIQDIVEGYVLGKNDGRQNARQTDFILQRIESEIRKERVK